MRKGKLIMFVFAMILLIHGTGLMTMAAGSTATKKALIIVDPGISGASYKIAQIIADDLGKKDFKAKIVKVKQYQASDMTGVDLLVLGGPTYAKQPSDGLKKLISALNATGMNTLVFQTGGIDCGGLTPLMEMVKAQGMKLLGGSGIIVNPNHKDLRGQTDKLLEKL